MISKKFPVTFAFQEHAKPICLVISEVQFKKYSEFWWENIQCFTGGYKIGSGTGCLNSTGTLYLCTLNWYAVFVYMLLLNYICVK